MKPEEDLRRGGRSGPTPTLDTCTCNKHRLQHRNGPVARNVACSARGHCGRPAPALHPEAGPQPQQGRTQRTCLCQGPSSSRRQHSNTCQRAQTSRLQRIPRLLRKCLPNGLTTAAGSCPLQCKWPSLRKWQAEFVTQHQRLFLGTVALLWGAEC